MWVQKSNAKGFGRKWNRPGIRVRQVRMKWNGEGTKKLTNQD